MSIIALGNFNFVSLYLEITCFTKDSAYNITVTNLLNIVSKFAEQRFSTIF